MSSALRTQAIIVLAHGRSTADRNNARGHLFERFIADLFHDFGYSKPTADRLNVSASGIELDVAGEHSLTRKKMVAECKAYSSPVSVQALSSFYGKLGMLRHGDPETYGMFVAIPSMTAEGHEFARKVEEYDRCKIGGLRHR